jgi:galactose oxidase-like protein/Kelch motif protein
MAASRSIARTALLLLLTARPSFSASDRAWRREQPLGQPPSPRLSASAVYDPAGDRMVVFGGYDYGSPLDETWLLSLNGRPKWSRLDPGSGPPAGSWDHSAVVDPENDRMLVFGGIASSGSDSTADADAVWALDLHGAARWAPLTVAGEQPPPRDAHSAVYDPIGKRMMVFGGGGVDGLLGDLWALDLENAPAWTQVAAFGGAPSARARHSAVYDPVHQRMVVFGGATFEGELLNDVWSLSLVGVPTWTRLFPEGEPPSPRAGHRAFYDPVAGAMTVFGGYQGGDDPFASDLWELSLGDTLRWRRLDATGPSPRGRFAPLMVRDDRASKLVLSGGAVAGAGADLWTLGAGLANGVDPVVFSVSPNPLRASGSALGFYLPVAGPLDVEVVDVTGRRVWSRALGETDAGWHSLALGAPLDPGVYWVRARSSGRWATARLVVLK